MAGTDEELRRCRHVIVNFPGGGFVAMSPKHHELYLRKWANYLHLPILCVDYRKAPEHPYPAGFNDAYDVYYAVVKTRGRMTRFLSLFVLA